MTMESEDLTIRGSLSESSLPELLASISRESKRPAFSTFHDAGTMEGHLFQGRPNHLRDVQLPRRSSRRVLS